MGGVIVAVAAAHAKRLQQIVDAFRLAGATAPARARPLRDLGVVRDGAFDELARAGVLVPGAEPGSWYLDETAYIARRDRRPAFRKVAFLLAFLVLALGILSAILVSRAGVR